MRVIFSLILLASVSKTLANKILDDLKGDIAKQIMDKVKEQIELASHHETTTIPDYISGEIVGGLDNDANEMSTVSKSVRESSSIIQGCNFLKENRQKVFIKMSIPNWVQNNYRCKKIGSKTFSIQKVLGPKKCCAQNNFGSKMILGPK